MEAAGAGQTLEGAVGSRDLFLTLLERLREQVSPRGMHLFQVLIIEEQSAEDVCRDFEMTREAVYAWRSRLLATARKLMVELQSEGRMSDLERSSRNRIQDGDA